MYFNFSNLLEENRIVTYRRTLDCEQLGLRVFYKTSKNFEGILT
jgi:hypothetical protein